MVHPRDIATVAAGELQNLVFKGSSVRYIVSDERKSPEIAAVQGAAISKPGLPYVPFSDKETRTGLLSAGFPGGVADNLMTFPSESLLNGN